MAERKRFKQGDTLAERYIIEKPGPLGEGGLAAVWTGREIKTQTQVAIKVPKDPTDVESVGQLLKEIHLLQQLSHPHIVKPIDGSTDSNDPYLVMKLAKGTVEKEIDRGEAIVPQARGVDIILQIGEALAYLHEGKPSIVHRDVKPGNMLIYNKPTSSQPEREEYQLADFGLARENGFDLLPHEAAWGTDRYAAPEQDFRLVVASSDQFALGRSAYEILTGYLPKVNPNTLQMPTLSEVLTLTHQENHINRLILALGPVILKTIGTYPPQRYPDMPTFLKELKGATQEAKRDMRTQRRTFQAVKLVPVDDPNQTQALFAIRRKTHSSPHE